MDIYNNGVGIAIGVAARKTVYTVIGDISVTPNSDIIEIVSSTISNGKLLIIQDGSFKRSGSN